MTANEQESYIEFTTIIGDGNGGPCILDCVPYCPQELIVKQYVGEKILSLDNLKKFMRTVPAGIPDSTIKSGLPVFISGRSEPFQNQTTVDMIEWLYERGHPVTIFSSGVGLKPKDAERLVTIPIEKFVLHLPDPYHKCENLIKLNDKFHCGAGKCKLCPKETGQIKYHGDDGCLKIRHAKIPYTQEYMETRRIIELNIEHLETMSMGWNFESNQCEGMARGNTPVRKTGRRACFFLEKPGYQVQPNGEVSFCCMVRGLTEIVGNLNENTYPELAAKHSKISHRLANDPNSICHRCLIGQKDYIYKFMKFKNRFLNGRSIMQVMAGGLLEDKNASGV